MKKNKKNKIFKFIFMIFFMSFLVIYFSELTGYYEYQNYKKTTLTEEQIKKFEQDVKNGKEVDINKYLEKEEKKYNNKLSSFSNKFSTTISDIVQSGVDNTFKFLSKFVEN